MTTVIFLVLFFYSGLIAWFIHGFDLVPLEKNLTHQPLTKFSIVIPFRNEGQNLNPLLKSLVNLNYPNSLFEIILVDDDSNDNSREIIDLFILNFPDLQISVLDTIRKSNSPKKDAIETAILNSKYEWIVTTDADCTVNKNWLNAFNNFIINNDPYFISAPLNFNTKKSFLHHFQHLNLLSLIGSTIGAFGINKPFLCNGANLCYKKDVFLQLNGFDGNSEIASGDDIFLLEKINKTFPNKSYFLKSTNAIVTTDSETSWTSFFNQQLRWASKSSAYKNWFSKGVGLVVLITNIVLITTFVSTFYISENIDTLIIFIINKMLFDAILMERAANFYKFNISYLFFIVASFLYPWFFLHIGISSLFKKYDWKGRTFKK